VVVQDQEEEGRKLMELARKQNHFQATEHTCNLSLRYVTLHMLYQLSIWIRTCYFMSRKMISFMSQVRIRGSETCNPHISLY
jgi:hypothetical protein